MYAVASSRQQTADGDNSFSYTSTQLESNATRQIPSFAALLTKGASGLAWSNTAVANTMPGYSKLTAVSCPPCCFAGTLRLLLQNDVVTNLTMCLEFLHEVLSSALPVHPEILHAFLDTSSKVSCVMDIVIANSIGLATAELSAVVRARVQHGNDCEGPEGVKDLPGFHAIHIGVFMFDEFPGSRDGRVSDKTS